MNDRYVELTNKKLLYGLTTEEQKEYEKIKHEELRREKINAVSAVRDFILHGIYPKEALDKINAAQTSTEIERTMCTLRKRYL